MDSVRKPSSINEAWAIVRGFKSGDPEQASLMLDDPDRVEKSRAEALAINRLRVRRRPLGSVGTSMLKRRYS